MLAKAKLNLTATWPEIESKSDFQEGKGCDWIVSGESCPFSHLLGQVDSEKCYNMWTRTDGHVLLIELLPRSKWLLGQTYSCLGWWKGLIVCNWRQKDSSDHQKCNLMTCDTSLTDNWPFNCRQLRAVAMSHGPRDTYIFYRGGIT